MCPMISVLNRYISAILTDEIRATKMVAESHSRCRHRPLPSAVAPQRGFAIGGWSKKPPI